MRFTLLHNEDRVCDLKHRHAYRFALKSRKRGILRITPALRHCVHKASYAAAPLVTMAAKFPIWVEMAVPKPENAATQAAVTCAPAAAYSTIVKPCSSLRISAMTFFMSDAPIR
jgi:hypothetical protein